MCISYELSLNQPNIEVGLIGECEVTGEDRLEEGLVFCLRCARQIRFDSHELSSLRPIPLRLSVIRVYELMSIVGDGRSMLIVTCSCRRCSGSVAQAQSWLTARLTITAVRIACRMFFHFIGLTLLPNDTTSVACLTGDQSFYCRKICMFLKSKVTA